jgi:hypothetical protein
MLNTLRKLNEEHRVSKNLIKEQETDVASLEDLDVNLTSSDESDVEIDEEDKNAINQMVDNFKQQVGQIVNFEPGLTIRDNEVRLDGVIDIEGQKGVKFTYIAGENDGVYINAQMLKLDDEYLVEFLGKMVKFQETFRTSMEPLINKRKNNI